MTDETEHTQELAPVEAPEDPHAAAPEENPEDHIGEEIPDPWADEDQDDWDNQEVEV